MTESAVVHRENHGPVVILTLNRPERRNALSRRLMEELGDLIEHLETDPRVRVLILAGSGPSFCAGMDLHEAVATMSTSSSEETAIADTKEIAHLINQIHNFSKPTIAELNGPALGGGAGIALACDFVIMSDRAKIGFPEVLRGLVPAIVMHDAIRQVGDKRVRELLLTGDILDAKTAFQWGLATRLVDSTKCRDEVLKLARRMLAVAPRAFETTKRLIDEATHRPVDLSGPAAISAAARVGDEASEGMLAFTQKRPPRWDVSESDETLQG